MPRKQAGCDEDAKDSGIGKCPVAPAVIILCSIFFTGVALLLLYALWKFFPEGAPAGGTAPATTDFTFLWGTFTLTREKDILVTVALAGGLGAMAHVLRSFFKYVGERKLRNSWLLSYFLIPLVGAIMATIVYIVIRAGLISGGGIDQTNPFGFAAAAVLVGLFSAQAAEKLKQVFETLFAAPPSGKDALEGAEPTVPPEDEGGAGSALDAPTTEESEEAMPEAPKSEGGKRPHKPETGKHSNAAEGET